MITVTIFVNGAPILSRSATRINKTVIKGKKSHYKVDTGDTITHDYDDGAVILAKKMLDTIHPV